LTPDRQVRVFISSTLGELAAERAAARRAIFRLRLGRQERRSEWRHYVTSGSRTSWWPT
jgi:hypothetical protein